MRCVFCKNENIRTCKDKRRVYAECLFCGGFFVLPDCFMFDWCQKQRYERHRNTLEDAGYRRFLESFILPVLDFLPQKPRSIFDYGCGPYPALVELLQERKHAGLLPPECVIRGWDPFFESNTQFFSSGAELVTCLEVVEHFESPEIGFKNLAKTLKTGAYAAVGTQTVPQKGDFLSWWYKEDATHVSFYTQAALESVSAAVGLRLVSVLTDRIFLFRKTD